MEIKWIMISAALIFCAMFAGIGVSEYNKSQCRIEAIKAGMDAESIVKTCGVMR